MRLACCAVALLLALAVPAAQGGRRGARPTPAAPSATWNHYALPDDFDGSFQFCRLQFRNSTTGELNVVYRRSDGHVGWFDPSG